MSEFLNKNIVITGASSGIGHACAMYYLNNGAKVALCGRDIDTLTEIGKKFPGQATVIQMELCKDVSIIDLKTTVIENFGKVDILINCAGVQFDGDIEKTFPQDFDYTIDVNLRAVFLIIKSFKEFFAEKACIVNVSCLAGTKPMNNLTGYCMSKAGLEILTKFAAGEFASQGIRVNAVTSCPVDSNSQRYVGVSENEYQRYKERVSKNIPLGRMATPDDVARAIVFLSSNRSSTITGHIMKVDGGRSLTSSGWTAWRGSANMNGRFEADGVIPSLKLNELYNSVYDKFIGGGVRKEVEYPKSESDIEKLLNESNWATNTSEAHNKVLATYKPIDQNDEFLMKKYTVNKK
jgi:NAD(P)-dependent dehydrogenase (short-subunit alcohol dehydrogenase family)